MPQTRSALSRIFHQRRVASFLPYASFFYLAAMLADDKRELQRRLFYIVTHMNGINIVQHQSHEPPIHNKNDGIWKAMTMRVRHAHVIHGTSGKKGEDKFCFASVGTFHNNRGPVYVCCFVRLRAFRGIHPPSQRRKGGSPPPSPVHSNSLQTKTTTQNNPHLHSPRTPRPLNSVDATSAAPFFSRWVGYPTLSRPFKQFADKTTTQTTRISIHRGPLGH